MNTIKFLKNNYIKLNQTIYKPYTICQLADTKFGQVDEDGYSLVNQWFNSVNSQELLSKAIAECVEIDKEKGREPSLD